MKLLLRLVIVIIVCLIATALPAAPVQAVACGVPFIELSPKSGVPGTELTVDGIRFYENDYVTIYYDGEKIATGTTDNNRKFTITFTVPEGCKGDYVVYAEVLDRTAETNFAVKPGLTVSPEKGPVGTTVAVKGQGFAQDEEGIALMYYLNSSYETVEGNITANGKGSWKTSLPIPASTRGEHRLDAQGPESKFYNVEDAIFKVTPGISVDKSSGIVGESITMTGVRFTTNEMNIKILFAGEAVVTDIKADYQGSWEESFQVPELPGGTYGVTVEGDQTPTGEISGLLFEIEPDIALSPEEGYAGKQS